MTDIRYDFIRMEEPFWKLEVKGIPFWHVVRMAFYEMIVEKLPDVGASHPDHQYRMSIPEMLKLGFRMGWGILVRHPLLRFRKEKDFLVVCAPRKVRYQGRYVFPILEPALDILEGNYNYLERMDMNGHIKDPGRKCLAYSDYMELKRLLNQVRGKYRMNRQEEELVDGIIAAVEDIFAVKLDRQQVYRRVNRNMTGYFTYYKAYQKLFRQVKPKYVLETTHYETAKLSLNKVAHEHGVKVYELQHGVMNVQYDVPAVDDYIPDILLTFGDYWNGTTSYPGRMVSVGNPHLEECVRAWKTTTIKEHPTVLFLSGGPIAKPMAKLALDMEQYCKKRSIKIRILFKLHPNEYQTWRELHPQLQDSSIEVIDNNERDLYYYFSIATHQIGVSSTALYEGLAFDLTTIIYKAYRYEMMSDLIDAGYAHLAEDMEEVMELILTDKQKKWDMDRFWKQNAKENLKGELLCNSEI